MILRTQEQFTARLTEELAWRKRELADLKFFIDQSDAGTIKRRVLARCSVTLLYAHWEGFVKAAGTYFLEYIVMQRLKNSELPKNLLTLSMHESANVPSDTKKMSLFGKFTDFFLDEMGGRAKINSKTAVNTESNLSSRVLKEILWCLGVDYSLYETKEKFIDSSLLARRNHVAHGKIEEISPDEYVEMRDTVVSMMENLKTQLENAVVLRTYKIEGASEVSKV